ncbi:diguanylate cyclase (GGDEF)-like protein [Krasilnikovia cinnamomea]|uniref:Diguanylate cyclase (GGDEF)-like protein n=1 Tax=Krasilnikovia cinnamomea TaxID=349313 RepID=A0A4Q7ZFT4_9ACTN|nr:GGDEF domain-containing protein [Krasilnikovia cinnamomea]RZU49640.1 diguanylate cyclase (GGDEF)-like protein [Krasilnikovia cinnamomea]
MFYRWYALAAFGLSAAYLAVPPGLRWIPFLLITLAAIPAALVGTRRSTGSGRIPWFVLLVALVVYNVGNVLSVWYVYGQHRPTADGTLADLLFSVANVLVFTAAMTIIVRRGRRDVGGMADAALTSLAVGGLLWDVVLLPHLSAEGMSQPRQMALFVNIFITLGTFGALLRVAKAAPERLATIQLFSVASVATLIANVAGALASDAGGVRPDWTNVPFLVAYAALGTAAMHPSAALATRLTPAPKDDLTVGRLTFLGAMMALIPLVGGGRALFGLPTDGVLLAIGSVLVVPLVMVRIAALSAERRLAEQALRRMAAHDSLTGLPNRAACLERITTALTAPQSDGPDDTPWLAVLFCDLDGFKPVNDRLGHAAGDQLLTAVAQRLRGCVRDTDLVSRFGGDEFVIVCQATDSRAAVNAVCERIRTMVRQPITIEGQTVQIGISVGVAFAEPGSTTDGLIGRADLAMYEAKKSKSLGNLSLAAA